MYLHDHKGRLSQALRDLRNIGRRYLLRLDPPTHLSFSRDLNAMNLVIRVTGKPNRVNEDVTLFLGSCGLGYGVLKLSHQGGFSKTVDILLLIDQPLNICRQLATMKVDR